MVCLIPLILFHLALNDHETGIFVSLTLFAVFFFSREVVLKPSINRIIQFQRQLGLTQSLKTPIRPSEKKLTIEENLSLLRKIQRKVEAAKVLEKIPEAHLEIFRICEEYLKITEKELRRISASSPRLSHILRGRRHVMELHKYHLLTWAELEVKSLIESSKSEKTAKEKIQKAEQAIEKLNFALSYYPQEESLIESINAIDGIITSIRVSEILKKAQKALSKNHIDDAIRHYEKAICYLRQSKVHEKELLIENIERELEKIVQFRGRGR